MNKATQEINYKELECTDAGNAELFAKMYNNNVIYNHDQETWYLWNGQYWVTDNTQHIKQLGKKVARMVKKIAGKIDDPDKSEKLFKHGVKLESRHKLNNMLNLARSEPLIAKNESDLNQQDYLLQFNNGVYDLNKDAFREGRPSDYISQTVGYNYDETATCPRFEQFLEEIFNGNQKLIDYMHKYIGYTISGDISDQSFLLLHGSGSNGKSVFLETLRILLGDYASNTSFDSFETQYSGASTNDIARLNDSRLVTCSELSGQEKKFNTERIKAVTGKEVLTARFLYQEYFEFMPKFKVYLAVNNLPEVSDDSYGFWRRVRMIPFRQRFEGDNRDKNLLDKLRKEIQGIANFAIEGFRKYQQHGLKPPQSVSAATEDYHDEESLIDIWLKENTVKMQEDKAKTSFDNIYRDYNSWIVENFKDTDPATKTKLGRHLGKLPYIKKDKNGGVMFYRGIKLKGMMPKEEPKNAMAGI
jgi:putative DNA primase/helicase